MCNTFVLSLSCVNAHAWDGATTLQCLGYKVVSVGTRAVVVAAPLRWGVGAAEPGSDALRAGVGNAAAECLGYKVVALATRVFACLCCCDLLEKVLMNELRGFPKRPPRIELFSSIRPFYFLTFNTHKRMAILADASVFHSFIDFSQKAHSDHSVSVGRFVIMPDHIHLFVAFPPEGPRLAQWVKALKTVLGKVLLQNGLPKPHWQEGFYDHVLRNSESYSQKWDYVRFNPVRAGLVENPEDWPWQGECIGIQY